jgi:hypothetical protein
MSKLSASKRNSRNHRKASFMNGVEKDPTDLLSEASEEFFNEEIQRGKTKITASSLRKEKRKRHDKNEDNM